MPKISIVIPVYGAEKYLPRCLDSLAAQTFADWECILVDDGSPDGSGAICDRYAQADPRFVVIHQKNQGGSAARNNGVDRARGEYLAFLDNDDAYSPFLLESVLAAQQRQPEDLIVWRYSSVESELAKKCCDFSRIETKKAGQLYLQSHLYYAWNKLFRLDLVRQIKLAHIPGITYGDDVYFSMEYARHWFRLHPQGCFAVSDAPLYFYESGNENSTTFRLKPCYCKDELWLTGHVLDWFERDFAIPEEDMRLVLIHLLKTIAGGLSVDAAQPGGKALAREHLNDPVPRRLVEKARALGCYSPFLFPMAHGFSSLTARLGGWMMEDSRWYHRVYWAGWHLRRLRTGQKPPVTL